MHHRVFVRELHGFLRGLIGHGLEKNGEVLGAENGLVDEHLAIRETQPVIVPADDIVTLAREQVRARDVAATAEQEQI